MGCFLACFGASKDEKRRKDAHIVRAQNSNFGDQYKPIHVPAVAAKQDIVEKPAAVDPEPRIKPQEEQLSVINEGKQEEEWSSATRKKVTFDSNVKEYEPICLGEGTKQDCEIEVNLNSTKPDKSLSVSGDGSTLSSLGSYPANHRYQNCRDSDDEELDCEISDLEEDEHGHEQSEEEEVYDDYCDDDYHSKEVPEISTLSCSSVESRTKCSMTCVDNDELHDPLPDGISPEIKTMTSGFNHNARNRAGYVHSVLNPIENTTQWKSVKGKGNLPPKQHKENLQMDASFDQFMVKSKSKLDESKKINEVAVDASLSTWLVSPLKTPPNKPSPIALDPISAGGSSYGSNSVRSQEERPILGALTVEELKQFSACSSPRRSLSHSPDEKPLVGTVGVHWNDVSPVEGTGSVSSFKGIPNTTSKYREDKKVNWHSTPFETRLERALNRGTAEA